MDRVTSMTAFATVVTSGSFAAAAHRLSMSPAMVTNHVRSLEERLGAPLINAFTAAYPAITVDLTTTDRMVDLVEDGVDVAIRFNQPPDSSLIVRRLGQLRIILCAAPDYLEKNGTPAELSDLSRHNCLAYSYRGFDKLTREWPLSGPGGEVMVPVTGN